MTTTTIYRALHLSVERDKERTDNITNLNVSALPEWHLRRQVAAVVPA